MALFIGLMSGTSVDGTDGVLAEWGEASDAWPHVLAHAHRPYEPPLRQELLALNRSGADEIHRAAQAAIGVAQAYAGVVADLLAAAGRTPAEVRAIGAHGQTVRHQPRPAAGPGYTVQLLDGAWLAEHGGIDVVCDFRRRDMAAGGEGAPLVPAFHHAMFADRAHDVAVLNIGGIANLSLLPASPGSDAVAEAGHAARPVIGFDCGPGNALMDAWCERHQGTPYDDDGQWAASGQVHTALLDQLLAEPYLALPPPKSTGRDLFDLPWLQQQLQALGSPVAPVDVQATLAAFTARTAADAVRSHAPGARVLLACGGGAFNGRLMQHLRQELPQLTVADTRTRGVPVDQVEALAFAWLARAFVRREPGNLPSVTGAAGLRVLGALHPH